jgi:hypothetical protein
MGVSFAKAAEYQVCGLVLSGHTLGFLSVCISEGTAVQGGHAQVMYRCADVQCGHIQVFGDSMW